MISCLGQKLHLKEKEASSVVPQNMKIVIQNMKDEITFEIKRVKTRMIDIHMKFT